MIYDFTLYEIAHAPTASVQILESVQKAWGFVPNLHRILAESPAALEAYTTLWTIAEKTGFTPRNAISSISRSSTKTNARIVWPATPTSRGWRR